MSRRKSKPLRAVTQEEREELESISRERSAPSEMVIRATMLLRVNQGMGYQAVAESVGRRDGDRVSALVKRFNREGVSALIPRHGGGPAVQYGSVEQERILREVQRTPTCEGDGTASWSLSTLQRRLRQAKDGLPQVSEYTLRQVLLAAGLWLAIESQLVSNGTGRTTAESRQCRRHRPRCRSEKKLIEQAYQVGEVLGLSVWCEDEAGPYQTKPYAGASWQPQAHPTQHPHEYLRDGTTKILTLFHLLKVLGI